jgi:hypothetical protein
MMKFRANLKRLELFPRSGAKAIDEYVHGLIEDAARVWLDAALAIVPAWSGASRATFEALASSIQYNVEIDVKDTAPDRIALGRLFSAGGIQRVGTGHWEFYYQTRLEYLIANETKNVKAGEYGLKGKTIVPTPYQFREAASKAVEEYIRNVESLAVANLIRLRGK